MRPALVGARPQRASATIAAIEPTPSACGGVAAVGPFDPDALAGHVFATFEGAFLMTPATETRR